MIKAKTNADFESSVTFWKDLAEMFRTELAAMTRERDDLLKASKYWSTQLESAMRDYDNARYLLNQFYIHGTDGCRNCAHGRITIYAKSGWCVECQNGQEKKLSPLAGSIDHSEASK